MKKATMIILALVLCCSFAFAEDVTVTTTTTTTISTGSGKELHEGVWMGGEVTMFHQGASMIIDEGKWDIELSLTAPLLGLLEFNDIDWYATVLSPKLFAGASYSVVNTNVFTWDFGAGLTGAMYSFYSEPDPEDPDKEVGAGSLWLAYADVNTTIKFNCGENFLLYATYRYPVIEIGGGSIGVSEGSFGAGMLAAFSMVYDMVDVGFLFKI